MTALLRTAVIGLGFFGSKHARVFADHCGSQLVAVCDVDFDRARKIAEHTGATPFDDFQTMLNDIPIDAMSVCMPDRMHEKAAIAVARAGKAMLLEKPLAHDTVTATRIMDAVEAAGTRLMVGHVLRFDPRYVSVFAASTPERLGDVVHLRAERTGIRATAERP